MTDEPSKRPIEDGTAPGNELVREAIERLEAAVAGFADAVRTASGIQIRKLSIRSELENPRPTLGGEIHLQRSMTINMET